MPFPSLGLVAATLLNLAKADDMKVTGRSTASCMRSLIPSDYGMLVPPKVEVSVADSSITSPSAAPLTAIGRRPRPEEVHETNTSAKA